MKVLLIELILDRYVAAVQRGQKEWRATGGVFVEHKSEGKTMSKQTHVLNPIYSFLPTEVEGFDALVELALDMRWSWNHYADEVWWQLDPKLWEITQNPWVILQTVSPDQIQGLLVDPAFRKKADALVKARRQAAEAPAWF